jgi:adenylate cyclase
MSRPEYHCATSWAPLRPYLAKEVTSIFGPSQLHRVRRAPCATGDDGLHPPRPVDRATGTGYSALRAYRSAPPLWIPPRRNSRHLITRRNSRSDAAGVRDAARGGRRLLHGAVDLGDQRQGADLRREIGSKGGTLLRVGFRVEEGRIWVDGAACEPEGHRWGRGLRRTKSGCKPPERGAGGPLNASGRAKPLNPHARRHGDDSENRGCNGRRAASDYRPLIQTTVPSLGRHLFDGVLESAKFELGRGPWPPQASMSIQPLPDFERRSRAVLAADVVGYTRLMEAAELETHSRYRSICVDVTDPTIVSHRGEIVKNTGDGFIAIFESPADALRCAKHLQQEVDIQETSQPPERRIRFRIGVHWDPVIFDLKDVYGSAVNIAARLQSVAPASGIVVSSELLGGIDDLGEFQLDDLGELRLKNLSRPVHAFSLRLPGVDRLAALRGFHEVSKRARLPSIAVLPFTDTSPETGGHYFAEGVVDDIIVTLANIPELLVVSRGSTITFHRRAIDRAKVSEKLGVRYCLSGNVRRSAGRLRLSVELMDVATASVIWAEKYDTAIEKVFDVQDEIAIEIVRKIATNVRRAEIDRALRMTPQSLNAYDYLLRAVDLFYRLDFASFTQGRTLLEKAIEEDHAYAAPYAFLAHWHMFNVQEGWSRNVETEAAEIVRLANCAIERDSSNAFAVAILGHAKSLFFRDYESALDLFDRSLALAPNLSWAWMFSSATYGFIGDAPTGIARAERAIRLSPLDQQAFVNYSRLGQNHYLNGSYEEAIRWSRKALSLNPRFGNAARIAAASLVAADRLEQARQISLHHKQILPLFSVSDYAPRCPFKEPQNSIYLERLKKAGLPA